MKYVSILLLFISFQLQAQYFSNKEPFAHTFSVVGRDPKTGDMAVAVQSHWFSVGTNVSWGEAGVGVVATQSFINKSFGLRGLALLKEGKTPQEALDALLQNDPGKEVRQVAILDTRGRVATHTGKNCIDDAGHMNGENFSVQANMMLNKNVVPAMEKAWKDNSHQELAERMVSVLKAAQAAGGDIRGKQSAALIVVKAKATNEPWNDRAVDIRVDDHEQPISELERILKTYRAYEHMNRGDLEIELGNMDKAMTEYRAAMTMFPDNLEMQYWTDITLASNKKVKEASSMLQKIYLKDPNWRELTRRLPKVGLLTVSPEELKELTR
ncbi:MAG TPA: DUF1028 domain-containing protein [Chitinophagaceae bacterium]|nr:DUF1028 domain-containing protein [Chitinophagaceae bacterium]